MARNANTKTKIAIEFELDSRDQDVLSQAAPESGLVQFLRSCIEAYLHEYSNGGLMLSGEEVARITKAANKEILSSEDVIDAIEKAKSLSRGFKTFQITLDPSLVDSMQSLANFRNMTIDEFLQDCWGEIHANGWLGAMNPDVKWIPFSEKDAQEIRTSAKVDIITSADVMGVLRKAAA